MSSASMNFIRAFEAGRQARRETERMAQEQEDRALERDILRHRVKALDLEDKLGERERKQKDALLQLKLLTGAPGPVKTEAAELQPGITPSAEIPQGVPEGAPQAVKDLVSGRNMQLMGMRTPGRLERTIGPHPPVMVPLLSGGEFAATAPTQEELQRQEWQQEVAKRRLQEAFAGPMVVPGPARLVNRTTGEVITPPVPPVVKPPVLIPGRDIPLPPAVLAQRTLLARESATAQAAATRAGTAEADRRAQDIRAANRLLVNENLKREREGMPALNSPPGTELAELEKTPQGPGVRRWGYGRKLPAWLARQYLQQANGDKNLARQMADADGWNRFQ